jgi:ribonucleoside-diphosphate reductase alpha chain
MVKTYGPTLPISLELHHAKYQQSEEDFISAMVRVGHTLGDNQRHRETFTQLLLEQKFLPAGRVQAAIGSRKSVTALNCYVAPKIYDSFTEGDNSIMDVAKKAAETMRKGGGIGYDFSTLRPRGDNITKLESSSSGPLSFMKIFNAVCGTVSSAGHRRGAQMGVLRIDHPDIEDFIVAKANTTEFTNFNLSVAVTDKFMGHLKTGEPFPLVFNGKTYRTVDPNYLWNLIMETTWDWAEPGVLFIDRINHMNNLYYCETIAATNPCGEQPLPPEGACLLGSFNLTKFVVPITPGARGAGSFQFDYIAFREAISPVVRAMDNVLDNTVYPHFEQENEAKNKRRMGLGLTGVANAIEACGYPYGSDNFCGMLEDILEILVNTSYETSVQLAQEKGPFTLFDDRYCDSNYIKTLPSYLQESIKNHGIRNSHLISIAPTGTISLTADNISSSIEPVFSYEFDRTITEFDGTRTETVQDYGVRVFGVKGVKSSDVTIQEHLKVLALASKYTDSAVSKTCNVPPTMNKEEFSKVYLKAYDLGCKGCTTFNSGGKRMGILNEKPEQPEEVIEGAACYIDLETGKKSCE